MGLLVKLSRLMMNDLDDLVATDNIDESIFKLK